MITYHILARSSDNATYYVERDTNDCDLETTIRDLISMQVDRPVAVHAMNTEERWSADVSEDIAREIANRADGPLHHELMSFIEQHAGMRLANELEAA